MSIFSHPDPDKETARRRFWHGLILAALILAATGLGYFYFTRPERSLSSSPARSAAAPPLAKAPPKDVPRVEASPRSGDAAFLEVSCDVEGAKVRIDGEEAGETPFETDSLAPGNHELTVEKAGHQPFHQTVELKSGRRTRVQAKLAAVSVVLRIASDVSGASVFIDRKYVGTTPVEARDVEPGAHQLTVSAEGYDVYAETLEVGPTSQDVMVRFKEVKLDESVQVVHKHRIGSCSGRLTATPQSLRYETSDKDAFSSPLSSLEGFEVDYLSKNLKIKLKGGRTYNFTESSGNADALYVFHQKVAAARN